MITTHMRPHKRKRKSEALLLIARAILDFETRLLPHLCLQEAKIDWRGIDGKEWSEDEQMAIHWMEAIWTEKMPRGASLCDLWQADATVREAVVCALATDCYTSYVIGEYYLPQQTSLD